MKHTLIKFLILLTVVLNPVNDLFSSDSTADISLIKQQVSKNSILLHEYKNEKSKDHDSLIQLQTKLNSLDKRTKSINDAVNNHILLTKKENKFDYQFYGIAFSVVIAALSLSWNIYNAFTQNRSKIKLDCSFQQQILQSGYSIKVVEPVFSLSIVNHGEKSKYIEQPFFRFNRKVEGNDTFVAINLDKLQNYPIKLQPGARKDFKYDIISINESIFKRNSKIGSLQINVPDTHGKLYKSKRLKKKKFLDAIESYNISNQRT